MNSAPTPSPEDKEPAEGDRDTVEQAIDEQEGGGAPGSPTVEQEIAEG